MHYNYELLLPGEHGVDEQYAQYITHKLEQLYPKAFLLCGLYLAGIHFGQKLMTNRAPFQLKFILILWNTFLSLFSLLGAIRFLPDFVFTLYEEGFVHSICVADYTVSVPGWWCVMFAVSKLFELGDTAFLVLRKKPVIFLHWYHHVTVLLYTWHGVKELNAPGRWFVGMNFTVHSIMYPYYLSTALGLRAPKWLRACITSLQLSQMFMGCFIMCSILSLRFVFGVECKISNTNLAMGSLMYASYMCLFLNFFYHAYLKKKPEKKSEKSIEKTAENHYISNGDVKKSNIPIKKRKKPAANQIAANGHLANQYKANGELTNGYIANGHVKHD